MDQDEVAIVRTALLRYLLSLKFEDKNERAQNIIRHLLSRKLK